MKMANCECHVFCFSMNFKGVCSLLAVMVKLTGEKMNLNCHDEPVPLDINGVLDLHAFRPSEVKSLVTEYIAECLARDILELRIIHGKGSGKLRAMVHKILERDKRVSRFSTAPENAGGWGATLVTLRR
jgi:dsDNA-specific endonuclease/ATPase MutS2